MVWYGRVWSQYSTGVAPVCFLKKLKNIVKAGPPPPSLLVDGIIFTELKKKLLTIDKKRQKNRSNWEI